MTSLLSAIYSDTRVRYLVIGGSAYLIELAVLFSAQAAGAPGTLAVAISFIVGTAISFLLQKVIAFKDRRFHKKIIFSQALLYVALVVFNFVFTVLAVWLLENYFPVAVIRTVALGITVIWNYYLYKTRIFNRNTEV
jgi:putative flippase GtrA